MKKPIKDKYNLFLCKDELNECIERYIERTTKGLLAGSPEANFYLYDLDLFNVTILEKIIDWSEKYNPKDNVEYISDFTDYLYMDILRNHVTYFIRFFDIYNENGKDRSFWHSNFGIKQLLINNTGFIKEDSVIDFYNLKSRDSDNHVYKLIKIIDLVYIIINELKESVKINNILTDENLIDVLDKFILYSSKESARLLKDINELLNTNNLKDIIINKQKDEVKNYIIDKLKYIKESLLK